MPIPTGGGVRAASEVRTNHVPRTEDDLRLLAFGVLVQATSAVDEAREACRTLVQCVSNL